jgi:hypothetical protein
MRTLLLTSVLAILVGAGAARAARTGTTPGGDCTR